MNLTEVKELLDLYFENGASVSLEYFTQEPDDWPFLYAAVIVPSEYDSQIYLQFFVVNDEDRSYSIPVDSFTVTHESPKVVRFTCPEDWAGSVSISNNIPVKVTDNWSDLRTEQRYALEQGALEPTS